MRKLIPITFIIYIIFLILGFHSYSEFDYNPLKEAKEETILENNLRVITQLFLGAALFGSTTVINLCYNGLYFGYLLATSISNGLPIQKVLLLVLPHGIFEIPAIILAGAAGFKIPYEILRYIIGNKVNILTTNDIKEYLLLVSLAIILTIIAAWIESNITLEIAESFK